MLFKWNLNVTYERNQTSKHADYKQRKIWIPNGENYFIHSSLVSLDYKVLKNF